MDYKSLSQSIRDLAAIALIFDAIVGMLCSREMFSTTISAGVQVITIVAFVYVTVKAIGVHKGIKDREDEPGLDKLKKTLKMVYFLMFLGVSIGITKLYILLF